MLALLIIIMHHLQQKTAAKPEINVLGCLRPPLEKQQAEWMTEFCYEFFLQNTQWRIQENCNCISECSRGRGGGHVPYPSQTLVPYS